MPHPNDLWSDGYMRVPRRWFPKDRVAEKEASSKREAKVDLLSLTNHNERDGLPKGYCDPSLSFLARRWKWTRSKVVRFLKELERERIIIREKWPGRRQTVTRFLAYEPPKKTDTLAIQRKTNNRYSEGQSHHGLSHPPRHSAIEPPDTVPEPNRTKRVGSARKEGIGKEKKSCPECWHTEISADQVACGRCIGMSQQEEEIAEWQPEQ